jgi:tetratricopeptide (TPR) repeat protein
MEIWKQAAALQIERKYEEALEKYREGLGYAEDARVREHVGMLERFLFRHDPEERNRLEAAREQAMAIWKYAAALQQAREYWEALERYREGLAIFENRRVREHVEKLELFIRRLLSLGGVEIRVQERKQGPLVLKS